MGQPGDLCPCAALATVTPTDTVWLKCLRYVCLYPVFSRALVQILWPQAKEVRFSIARGAKSAAGAAMIVRCSQQGKGQGTSATATSRAAQPDPAGPGSSDSSASLPQAGPGWSHRIPAAGRKARGISPGSPRDAAPAARAQRAGLRSRARTGRWNEHAVPRGKGTHGLKVSGSGSPSGAIGSRLATRVLAGGSPGSGAARTAAG